MADIKKTISLEYQAKGLESILKNLKDIEKIKLIGKDDKDDIKNLRKDTEELMKTFSPPGSQIVDPREAEKIIAKFEAIVERAQDIRAKAFESVNPLGESSIPYLQKLIRDYEKQITAYERKPDGTFSSPTKEKRQSHLKKLVSTEEGGGNILENKSMVSNLGNKMTNPVNFLSTMEKISEVLQKTDGIESSILEKLEQGEELTKEEETSLNLALEKAKEKYTLETQNSEKVLLSATELTEQYKNRNTILEEEQESLQGIHEAEIERLKTQIQAQKEALAVDQEAAIQESLRVIREKDPEERTKAEKELLEANNVLAESEKTLENLTRQNINAKKEAAKASYELTEKEKKEKKGKDALRGSQDKANNSISQAAKQVLGYGLVLNAVRKIYRETIKTIKDLDQALTEMAIVTSMNREQTWNLLTTFQDLATQTGFTTTEIAKLSTIYFRQGKSLTDVIKLTTAAAKAARVAGISAEESANYLTAAVNGFGLAADQALAVSDRFAALAASSASSYEELATGLSKFAAQANIAGMSIDFALGMLAKGVETTREAPETIGTALKTVISRMRELTDLGKTLDDGMDVNRVDKALGQIGIRLMGTNGQFRDMQDVLTDVGMAWSTLNTNQQASVAVALAGTRQQSRLIAIMNDFPRTLELVQTAEESAGATNAQHMEYMNSMAAAMTGLQTAWQKFITTITDSEIIIGIVRTLTSTVEFFSKVLDSIGLVGKNAMIAIGALVLVLQAHNIQTKIANALGIKSTVVYWKNIIATMAKAKSEEELNKIEGKGLIAKIAKIIALKRIKKESLSAAGGNVALSLSERALAAGVVKGTGAWTAYWIAATAGIAAIIAGIVAIIVIIVKLIKQQKQLSRSVEEVKNEYSALNYELNKTNKSMKSVIEKYDELSKKSIKTDEDREALAELQSEIENFGEDKEFVVYKMSGEIDWDSSIAKMNEAIKNNELEIRENWETVLGHAIYRATVEGMTKAIQGEISNFVAQDFISGLESEYDESSEEAIELFVGPKIEGLSDEQLEEWNALENNYEKALWARKKFKEEIEGFYEEYSEKVEDFKGEETTYGQFKIWDGIKKEGGKLKEVFKTIFKEETDLFEAIGNNEQMYKLVEGLKFGFSDAAEIYNILALEGKNIKETFSNINGEIERLMKEEDYSEIEARNIAILQMADSIEDAERKMKLYNMASSKDSVRLAQDLETTTTTLKNFDEMQKKYLSGDTTASELEEFLSKHEDVMSNEDFWTDFSSGASLAKYKADELKENYDEIIAAITTIDKQIKDVDKEIEKATKSGNEEELKLLDIEKKGLEVKKQIHLALIRYHGEFADGGHLLSNYNNLLENYNRLLKYGIDQIELLNKAKEASAKYTASELGRVQELIDAHMEANEAYSKLVDTTNGTPILADDWADSLDNDNLEMTNFNTWFDKLKELYNEEEKIAEEYIDSNIKQEQELIDKKIKIYEDYFKALDKLEDARERKQSREDITKQLQRLSGATDEASRKKAKDLRAELIKLDEQSKKDERKESRDSLIEGLKLEKEAISTMWGKLIEDFVDGGKTVGQAMASAIVDQWNAANPKNPITLTSKKTNITDPTNVEETSSGGTVVGANYETHAIQRDPDYGSVATDLTASDLRSNGIDPNSYMMYAWQKGYTKISPRKYDEALERDGVSAWDSMEVNKEGLENYLIDSGLDNEKIFSTITGIDKAKSITKNPAYEKLFDMLHQRTMMISSVGTLEDYDIKKFRNLIPNPQAIIDSSDLSTVGANTMAVVGVSTWNELAEKFGGTWNPGTGDWEDHNKIMNKYKRLTEAAGYKKGGLVDYTGPAMVHGSKTQPEAFLNAKQTELFANLRDMLQKVSVDSNSSSGFVIENITIQTQELNNNQDFKKAGRTLADEFASAIKSRGLNLNVKR